MVSPARQASYTLLCHIELRGVFSDDALNSDTVDQLGVADRHLTTEIVYGTLRWQALLDYVLAKVSSRPWPQVDPEAQILLRMSLYQMWQLDRIPDHALVNDAVELAKRELRRGIHGFINGVLRQLARKRLWKEKGFLLEAPPWIQVSLPQWLWERWSKRFGESAAKDFALSLNAAPETALRRTGREDADVSVACGVVPSDIVPGAYLRVAGRGEPIPAVFQYQDEASQLIPHLLGAIRGWRIWDACAAPGGKSAILCEKCGESGRVFASDYRWERTRRLATTLKSTYRDRAHVIAADARKAPPFRGSFDAVLVDIPCSGLGTLRRNPEIKWRIHPEELLRLQRDQLDILCSVAEAVRARLLYSTCSTEPEENEQVVQAFMGARPDFHILPPADPPGIEAWTGHDGMVRTFPGTRSWDAFFGALMVRQY